MNFFTPIRLRYFNIQSYTTSEFTTYRETGSGRYQFQGVGSLTSIGGRCNDVTGCVCRSASNAQVSVFVFNEK